MAKLEIPSIVVQSGTHTPPKIDRKTRSLEWSLSKKTTYDEDDIEDLNDGVENLSISSQPSSQSSNCSDPAAPTSDISAKTNCNPKLKLHRSNALTEANSPPISPTNQQHSSGLWNNNCFNTLNKNKTITSPSSGSNPASMNGDNSLPPDPPNSNNRSDRLSRGNSTEQTFESAEKWLREKINSNRKDCHVILRIEKDFIALLEDPVRHTVRYDSLTAYHRLIVHKCAQFYSFDHHTIRETLMVITKPKNYVPTTRRIRHMMDREFNEGEKKSILKRSSASFEETKSPERHNIDAPRRSKSFEEREEEYEKVRRRIFQPENTNNDTICHNHDGSKLHPGSRGVSQGASQGVNQGAIRRFPKNESFESHESLKANSLRNSIGTKSHSFGGYDDSPASNSKVLIKQDSGSSVSSRVSPGSSGYKSLRSDTTISGTPSPSVTPYLASQLSTQSETCLEPDPDAVVWAVTSISNVPSGSVLINPQTGLPYVNEDGSTYHFDPENPPCIARLQTRSASQEDRPDSSSHNPNGLNTGSGFVEYHPDHNATGHVEAPLMNGHPHPLTTPGTVHPHGLPHHPISQPTLPTGTHHYNYPLANTVMPTQPSYHMGLPLTGGHAGNETYTTMYPPPPSVQSMYSMAHNGYNSMPMNHAQPPAPVYDRTSAPENGVNSVAGQSPGLSNCMMAAPAGERGSGTVYYTAVPQYLVSHAQAHPPPPFPHQPHQGSGGMYIATANGGNAAVNAGGHRYPVVPVPTYACNSSDRPQMPPPDWIPENHAPIHPNFHGRCPMNGQGAAGGAGYCGVGNNMMGMVMPPAPVPLAPAMQFPRGYQPRMPPPTATHPAHHAPQYQNGSYPVYYSYPCQTMNAPAAHMSNLQMIRPTLQLGAMNPGGMRAIRPQLINNCPAARSPANETPMRFVTNPPQIVRLNTYQHLGTLGNSPIVPLAASRAPARRLPPRTDENPKARKKPF